MSKENISQFVDDIEKVLSGHSNESTGDINTGIIESYKDGVIEIKGLPNLRMGELVTVKDLNVRALVLNLEKDVSYAVVLEMSGELKEGLFVESKGVTLSLPVSENIIGRVVDPLGIALDGKGEIKATERYPHEKIAPGVMSRKSVHEPVQTGILAIDSLIPVGRGQRELIIGDRQTGKTTVAIDTILNQADQNMKCIYVGIGQREGRMRQVYEVLKANGAMDYTTIVSAPASSSAALQFLAPYAGVAIAEYFCDKGEDVLIVYDDLSKHAVSYREMSLLLRRPPGREAYPGDVFYLHSRLLERAIKLNENYGGGSITALPIIETQAGDVSAYIPTNVISITDGQMFLEADLFNKGIRPAINVGISVSRVGGAAQTKVIKKLSGRIKLDLAQYYELEAFSQFASDLDESTLKSLRRGERVVESLKQKQQSPYALWEEAVVIYAATNGYLDKFEKETVVEKIAQLLAHIEVKGKDLIDAIMDKKELTDEVSNLLEKHISEFLK